MKEKEQNAVSHDFTLLEAGREYNRSIGLYDTVDRNERFYRGDQWHGVKNENLPTPVFNLFRRVISYFVSTILSQKISLYISAEGSELLSDDRERKTSDEACGLVTRYLNYRYEKDKIDELLARGLKDAAVTGDFFLYVYWDPSRRTSQGYRGDFVTVLLDNTSVFFGDVNSTSIDDQPYILLAGRDLVSRLRREAKENGAGERQLAAIVPDSDLSDQTGDFGKKELEGTKASYVIKLFKKNGTVHYRKSCRGTVIVPETDTGLTVYPVALMNWETVKNSYHGNAVATSLIDNQLYINKAFAMVMKHMMDLSFSKVVYNANIIDEWSGEVGEAIAVNGPVDRAAIRLEPGSMQNGFLEVINLTMNVTKELMGATDAALGNVSPDNTSAIIALQESAAVPLEMQRKALYSLVERLGLIWLDFMMHYFAPRRMLLYRDEGKLSGGVLPTGNWKESLFHCNVQAGAAGYWSELAQVNTLDRLLQGGHLTFLQYLERLPDGCLARRKELIAQIRKAQEENTNAAGEIPSK